MNGGLQFAGALFNPPARSRGIFPGAILDFFAVQGAIPPKLKGHMIGIGMMDRGAKGGGAPG